MKQFILDTNVLCRHWRRARKGTLKGKTTADAESWARDLIGLLEADAIVTPVAIEFVCGVVDRHEMELSRAFLDVFDLVDGGVITGPDWERARQYAERIPRDPAPRDFGDCLIKAIAIRLGYEVFSFDAGMPRAGSIRRGRRTKPKG